MAVRCCCASWSGFCATAGAAAVAVWWGSLGTRRRDVEDNDSGLAHEMINEMNDRAKTGRLHHWMLHSRAWPVATTWWLAGGWGWGGSMSNGKRFYDDFCVVEKVEQVSQITRELNSRGTEQRALVCIPTIPIASTYDVTWCSRSHLCYHRDWIATYIVAWPNRIDHKMWDYIYVKATLLSNLYVLFLGTEQGIYLPVECVGQIYQF